ncbi:thiamine phosphate synthase [soil metagenome]
MTFDPARLRLYLVADPAHSKTPLVDAVALALHAGVSAVQLRAKRLDDRSHLQLAREMRAICHQYDALFLVNDRLDIALLAGADGVHVGVSDISPTDIRRYAGNECIVGYSPESMDVRVSADADYLGIGPVFGTTSKQDAGQALGIDEFQKRVEIVEKPVVGIGGITPDTAQSVLRAGAFGVAVISAILNADDVGESTAALRKRLDPAR